MIKLITKVAKINEVNIVKYINYCSKEFAKRRLRLGTVFERDGLQISLGTIFPVGFENDKGERIMALVVGLSEGLGPRQVAQVALEEAVLLEQRTYFPIDFTVFDKQIHFNKKFRNDVRRKRSLSGEQVATSGQESPFRKFQVHSVEKFLANYGDIVVLKEFESESRIIIWENVRKEMMKKMVDVLPKEQASVEEQVSAEKQDIRRRYHNLTLISK